MKLTHINSYYYTNRLHEALVRKLREESIQQHVFLPVPNSDVHAPPEVAGVSFTYSPCFNRFQRLFWGLKMRAIWRSYLVDQNETPAALNHAHTLFVNGLIAYWAKLKFGTPYVVTIRNTDVNHFLKKLPAFFRPLGQRIMCASDAVITLSSVYWDQQIRRMYPDYVFRELDEKHYTIPNGCEDEWFSNCYQKSAAGCPVRLLFVGRLDSNKNLAGLLKACRLLQLKGFDFSLRVIGSGPKMRSLKKLGCGMPVSYCGYMNSREELRYAYRESDILVVPSFTESFGVVYAEAMTQGLPVIYTRGQGFDGFFADECVGCAVDPYAPDDIARAIEFAYVNYGLLSNQVARRASYFKWANAVSRLNEVYGKILKA